MNTSSVKDHPEVRKLWWITLVIQSTFGFTKGLYLYIYGPYLYESFGGSANAKTAMLLSTIWFAIQNATIALLEVPTGAIADAIGRVNVVISSWIARVLFFLCLAAIWLCSSVVTAFTWAVLASLFFSLSYTLFNGAFSAWCVETLKEKAPHVSYGWLVSRFYSYQSFSVILGGIISVLLHIHGGSVIAFSMAAIFSFCCMGYCMYQMREVKSLSFLKTDQVQFATITKRIGEIIGRGTQACAKTPVLFWIVLTYGSYMFLLNLVVYLWPVYFQTKFSGTHAFGRTWVLIVVGSQLLSTLSSRLLVKLNHRWSIKNGAQSHLAGFRRIFVATALFSSVSIIALSLDTAFHKINVFIFPAAVIVVMFSFGIIGPCFETLINAYIPPEDSQERATIMSAGSMLRSLLILILAVPSGGSSGENSPVHWAIPAVLLLLATIFANFFMKQETKQREIINNPSVAQLNKA